MNEDPWVCRFGYPHPVPSLAAACTGAAHGLDPDPGQDDEEVG